ncbi:hypothetical protein Tsubulata_025990 [Turnera subulata]|uniref:Uncharacterized protein n=1 Tax=Turnera subulata TaxID=218843 RepID=A0A9Q0FLN1_9ROSI|nr:hypothetical protein Tsubulata_025990 [Turnera subulata]
MFRFSEVARLRYVCWLEIQGRIEAKMLSRRTTYAVYLVFKFDHSKRGFNERPVEMCVSVEGDESGSRCTAFLDPPGNEPQLSRERGDGWMEIVMGRFFNDNGDDGGFVCSLCETDDYTGKHGLVIEGIEFRPED